MKKHYLIIAIETSLDETCAAVTVNDRVLSNVISSQVELHKKYGGVVPIIAKRAHEERIEAVMNESLKRASVQLRRHAEFTRLAGSKRVSASNRFRIKSGMTKQVQDDSIYSAIDAIAVTVGPGQALALEIGIKKAKSLAKKYRKPLIAVSHMEGHLLSSFARNAAGNNPGGIHEKLSRHSEFISESNRFRIPSGILKVNKSGMTKQVQDDGIFPLLGLLISGGHTQLVLVHGFGKYELLGETLDDAAGEAFDKVGRMLGIGYPGGPIIERLAKDGDERAFNLPIPMRKRRDENFNFSYSGIKTALLYLTRELKEQEKLDKQTIQNLAASFQRVVMLSLIDKLELAVNKTNPKGILLGGGVISNLYIRNHIRAAMSKLQLPVYIPYSKKLFTDNAAMIGVAAYFKAQRGEFISDIDELDRMPNLSFARK